MSLIHLYNGSMKCPDVGFTRGLHARNFPCRGLCGAINILKKHTRNEALIAEVDCIVCLHLRLELRHKSYLELGERITRLTSQIESLEGRAPKRKDFYDLCHTEPFDAWAGTFVDGLDLDSLD